MSEKTSINKKFQWESFVAGVAGGMVPIIIFHPLELVKIRYQVNEYNQNKYLLKQNKPILNNRPMYKNLFDSFIQVYKQENGLRGLYRGLNINVTASGAAWGLYFLIYNSLKSYRYKNESVAIDNSTNKLKTILNYTIDASLAGAITIFITNPLFLIKTRMCLQYTHSNQQSSFSIFKNVIKQDGFLGLYKGFLPGLFGTLNGTIQMVSYDLIKLIWFNFKHYDNNTNESKEYNKQVKEINNFFNSFDYLVIAGLSKSFAVLCTYPFQLIRSRSQDQHRQYNGFIDIVKRTYRQEGFFAFYKGLIPCLLRVTPAASITFIVYENSLKFLTNK